MNLPDPLCPWCGLDSYYSSCFASWTFLRPYSLRFLRLLFLHGFSFSWNGFFHSPFRELSQHLLAFGCCCETPLPRDPTVPVGGPHGRPTTGRKPLPTLGGLWPGTPRRGGLGGPPHLFFANKGRSGTRSTVWIPKDQGCTYSEEPKLRCDKPLCLSSLKTRALNHIYIYKYRYTPSTLV